MPFEMALAGEEIELVTCPAALLTAEAKPESEPLTADVTSEALRKGSKIESLALKSLCTTLTRK